MFGRFSEEAQKVLVMANKEMSELKHPYVGSEHLFLAILKQNSEIASKLKKYKITYKNFKESLIDIIGVGTKKSDWFLYTPLIKRVIEECSFKKDIDLFEVIQNEYINLVNISSLQIFIYTYILLYINFSFY